jgi:glycosyltransferase involved in cell wall biosynthesis
MLPTPPTPLFSYVVATYNCAPLLPALAATARRLLGSPTEICVSDGGSTDGTAQALRSIPGLRLVCCAPDSGIYDAWNRALPFVRGRYVGFLGVDDEPRLPFITAAAAAVSRAFCAAAEAGTTTAPALIYGDMVMHRRGRVRRMAAPQRLRLFDSQDVVFDLHHPGCLTRADLFVGEQAFDPSFKLAGDFDFYIRMAQQVRAAGMLRLDQVQADVVDGGASRRPQALALYAQEHARIAKRSGLQLGHAGTAWPLLAALARAPVLFEWGKNLSWALRGRREQRRSHGSMGLPGPPPK